MALSSCKLCAIPISQGIAVFAVIELFMVLIHIKHFVELAIDLNNVVMNDVMGYVNPIEYRELCLHGLPLFLDIVKGAFCACLLVQIFFAFLLYFVGYAKKNTAICWLWVFVSAYTLIMSIVLIVSSLCETPLKGTASDPYFWKFQRMVCGRHPTYGLSVAVYELYLFFGIWVVVEHINSVKGRAGGAATATVMPVTVPQQQQQQTVYTLEE